MRATQKAPKSIDDYIAGFPAEIQEILQKIRVTIRTAAPEAEEAIKYRMPTFTLQGNLIYFAVYQKHIGLYPAPTGSQSFNQALSLYRAARSTVRFPLERPIPYDLIRQMVKLRVKDNRKRAAAKAKTKQK